MALFNTSPMFDSIEVIPASSAPRRIEEISDPHAWTIGVIEALAGFDHWTAERTLDEIKRALDELKNELARRDLILEMECSIEARREKKRLAQELIPASPERMRRDRSGR